MGAGICCGIEMILIKYLGRINRNSNFTSIGIGITEIQCCHSNGQYLATEDYSPQSDITIQRLIRCGFQNTCSYHHRELCKSGRNARGNYNGPQSLITVVFSDQERQKHSANEMKQYLYHIYLEKITGVVQCNFG